MFNVSLIIPTYNKAKNIPFLVKEIFDVVDKIKINMEFIIVDDNSPDGTGKIAEDLADKYNKGHSPFRKVRIRHGGVRRF